MWELQNEIAGLLSGFCGEEPLKKLFWTALGYDRVEAAIPQRLLDGDLSSKFQEVRLLAEYRGLNVVYARMTSQQDGAAAMRALAGRVTQAMPYALLVFSDAGQSAWSLVFERAGSHGLDLRHLEINGNGDNPSHLAGELSRLRTFTAEGGERPMAALLNAFDSVFGTGARTWKQGRKKIDLSDIYWQDVRRYDRLAPDQEHTITSRLAELRAAQQKESGQAATPRSTEYLNLRSALVCANLRLAAHLAFHSVYKRKLEGLELMDLIQAGNIGLIRAADRFEPAYGTRFSTYAFAAVRTHQYRTIVQEDVLVRLSRQTFDSRNQLAGRIVENAWFEQCPDRRELNEEETLIALEKRDIVMQEVQNLSPAQAAVITSRFGLLTGGQVETLEDVARAMGVTRERVRQIELKALARLRFVLNSDGTRSGKTSLKKQRLLSRRRKRLI